MFDLKQFIADLDTFVGFKTCVDINPIEFERARDWIRTFYDPTNTEFIELEFEGYRSLLLKPAGSSAPKFQVMATFYRLLQNRFPNPSSEKDWRASMVMTSINGGEEDNKIPERCIAGFDARLTEHETVDEVIDSIKEIARPFGAVISIKASDKATFYPRETPIARRFIDILRRVSGQEPAILWTNGASNGRIYLEQDDSISVLMSNPYVWGAHAEGESLEIASIEPYYDLVMATAQMSVSYP